MLCAKFRLFLRLLSNTGYLLPSVQVLRLPETLIFSLYSFPFSLASSISTSCFEPVFKFLEDFLYIIIHRPFETEQRRRNLFSPAIQILFIWYYAYYNSLLPKSTYSSAFLPNYKRETFCCSLSDKFPVNHLCKAPSLYSHGFFYNFPSLKRIIVGIS